MNGRDEPTSALAEGAAIILEQEANAVRARLAPPFTAEIVDGYIVVTDGRPNGRIHLSHVNPRDLQYTLDEADRAVAEIRGTPDISEITRDQVLLAVVRAVVDGDMLADGYLMRIAGCGDDAAIEALEFFAGDDIEYGVTPRTAILTAEGEERLRGMDDALADAYMRARRGRWERT